MSDAQHAETPKTSGADSVAPAKRRTVGGALILLLAVVVTFAVVWGGGTALKIYEMNHPSEEAKSSEARATLGALKDRARVVYQRTGKAPTMADLGLGSTELDGNYFKKTNYSCGGAVKQWWAKCAGVYESEPHDLILTADIESGDKSFNR